MPSQISIIKPLINAYTNKYNKTTFYFFELRNKRAIMLITHTQTGDQRCMDLHSLHSRCICKISKMVFSCSNITCRGAVLFKRTVPSEIILWYALICSKCRLYSISTKISNLQFVLVKWFTAIINLIILMQHWFPIQHWQILRQNTVA